MATVKHSTVATSAEVIPSAALASLAQVQYTAASAATEFNNESGLNLFADFSCVLGSLAPSGNGYVALYIIPEIDGTYPVSPVSGTTSPGEGYLAAVMPLANVTAATRAGATNVPIPAQKFRCVVGNFAGAALAATGNQVLIFTHNIDVA